MKEAVRIVIKGSSGYGPIDEAYEDKVTICNDAISYEFKPITQGGEHAARKWSYKTTSPVFSGLFQRAVTATEEILAREDDEFVCDIGMTSFTIVYTDKSKHKKEYFLPSDDFKECFTIIKKMVPRCEDIPSVLTTSDDWSIE